MAEQDRNGETGVQFLNLCLQGRWDPTALQAARDFLMQDNLNWEALLQIARDRGLAPLLYFVVRGRDLLPPQFEQELRLIYFLNARRNLLLFRRLEEALCCLTAEHVSVIVLKGAALAEAVYGNPAVRLMSDFDLLVRQTDIAAALRVLAALDYERVHVEAQAGDTFVYENEVALVRPGEVETPIEIHWSLFDSPYYQYRLPMDWFWRTAVPLTIGKAAVRMLGPEALVLHLCGHLLLHHGGGEPGSLWLYDVAEVIASYGGRMDWGQVLARAQTCDLVLPVQQILVRLDEELHAPIPPAVLGRLRTLRPSRGEERVFAQLTAARRPVAQRFWVDLVGMPGWGPRWRFAWRSLFPSAGYMEYRYNIPHRLMVPLYYPYRWLLGLRSALRWGGRSDSV